jgi:beta-glucosidase-like glycosyl hydrolase
MHTRSYFYLNSPSNGTYRNHSFGPDPYLNGEGAYETIVGVQSIGVQACAKHFLANNQEHWRYGVSANLDDRTMHEMYFYPFLRSIEVMPSSLLSFLTETASDWFGGLSGRRSVRDVCI